MRRITLLLLTLAFAACDSQRGGPLDPPDVVDGDPKPIAPYGPMGPQRPYGTDPSLASQSTTCSSRCGLILGTPAGSQVTDLNNVAEVLGYDAAGPYYWSKERGLNRIGSTGAGIANFITDWSYLVGGSSPASPSGASTRAYLWTSWGGARDLGTLGGLHSTAFGSTDDGGSVVGSSELSGGTVRHAFIWTQSGGMRDLGTLASDGQTGNSEARALNASGQVVGWSATSTRSGPGQGRAFLWTPAGGMQDLGVLSGHTDSRANAISGNGWVVGASYTLSGSTVATSHAFLWRAGQGMTDLGTLGGSRSEAHGVNDWGEVVGTSTTASGQTRAFVWREETGMVALDDMGRHSTRALAVNSWGDILGIAESSGGATDAIVWGWSSNLDRYRTEPAPPPPPPPPPAPPQQAAITITFDDGWETTYTNAFPILREHGLTANVGVITVSVDYWTGFLTLPQLRELEQAGWGMVSHTVSHPDLKTVPAAELDRQLRDSQQWLKDRGFSLSDVVIIPYHSWADRELQAVKRFYGAARGVTSTYYWPERYQRWPAEDPYSLTSIEPEYSPFTTPQGREDLRRKLDRVVANGEFVDVFFHQIKPEHVEAFRETVKILAEYKSYIRTYPQLFPSSN